MNFLIENKTSKIPMVLKSFNENSDKQLSKEIKVFEKKEKPVGYIIDVRNNIYRIKITEFAKELK